MRRVLLLLLPLLALGALAVTWREVERARVVLRDVTDAGLARAAADYLTTVTPPGAVGEFDGARLLSGAHALAGTSFWPGGLQVLVGNTPLLPDSLGLLPLPDSLLRLMDQSSVVVRAQVGGRRVQLVPLLARSGNHTGAWVAVWNGARSPEPGILLRFGYIGTAGGLVILALLGLLHSGAPWRWAVAATTIGFVLLIRLALGSEWESQLRESTELRIRTLRHLVEIAATAPGVRQVTVPNVAASATVVPFALTPPAQSEVVWVQDSLGLAATILAATPRTLSGLKLVLHLPEPPEQLTGRVMPWLIGVLAIVVIMLVLSGLSPRPAIFHTEATPPGLTPPGNA